MLRQGYTTELEPAIKVKFKGVVVGNYAANLLVDGKVIVKPKVAKKHNPKDEPRLLNELKATEKSWVTHKFRKGKS
ncbi:hypothetical protein B6I21_05305 [candidate division KSB1 bacterium 4572_119]|nr:MAG: hypothetical protein B6I21_05305 [candidate division KSB1 bacterium 4572_119]